jgi:hypothetical protein
MKRKSGHLAVMLIFITPIFILLVVNDHCYNVIQMAIRFFLGVIWG